ncbi:MAG TPA: hypothetical protein VKA98_02205 [Nitrososphaeraceae archaeon]|nr:hypothetical protein [Nitrososphaeraceae archaeon]
MGKGILPLLSVHTLEIGYDTPQAAIAIIISSNSIILFTLFRELVEL